MASWPASLQTVLRLMLSSRYAMWLGWGPELTFFYNDAYVEQTLGSKHPETLGRPFREVWSEVWDTLRPRIDQVLETGEATWDEGLMLFLERDGRAEETYHTFSYSAAPGDAPGEIAGIFCVVIEETERVISERRITLLGAFAERLNAAQTEAEVFFALEQCLAAEARDIPFSATYLFDERGAARQVSSTGLIENDATWPFAEAQAMGAPALVTLDAARVWPKGPWDKPPTNALLVPIANQGHGRIGGIFVAALNPYRPHDQGFPEFVQLLVGQIAAALTNARSLEEEKKRADALAEIDRAKTAFFSNVSHEFRTPLTLMLGPTEDALASPNGALVGENLEIVHRNELRLLKLVNTLLDFSRLESGRATAKYVATDLSALTADLVSAFRSATERAGIELVFASSSSSESIFVDHDMWEKIVFNLLSNALKFTFHGTITVAVRDAGDAVELTVRDTGVGIPEAELPHLFERFHRVENTRARTHEGSGIGLALVSELTRMHGGEVTVRSEVDVGSTFSVRVPKGSAHLPTEKLGDSSPRTSAATGARFYVEEATRWLPAPSPRESSVPASDVAPPGEGPGPERILLADDNADMREYLERLLSPHWSVEAVDNGGSALAAARMRRPTLILTDVMMPVLDGFGLLRALRADPVTAGIPVLLLSARAGEEARVEGIAAGADDYVVKPFAARELVARVAAHLQLTKVRGALTAERERLAIAQSVGNFGIFDWDIAKNELYWSPELYRLLGLEADAIPPSFEAWTERMHPDHRERALSQHREAVEQQKIMREAELQMRLPDGSYRWIRTVQRIFYSDADEAVRVVGAAVDIQSVVHAREVEREQMVRANHERESLLIEARSANRAKDEFLAMLGHELRNPLAPMLTALQVLRVRGIEGGERERTILERQVHHLVRLIDDLLDVSRIARGQVVLQRVRVEIAEVIAKAVEAAAPLMESKEHRLRIDVARTGLLVDGDVVRLAQVFSNLLINAAKYTNSRGNISLVAAREESEVVVTVTDDGLGIAPELLPRLFDMFVQDRQSIDRSRGGLGLGLAIVRSLVGLHGGKASARSEGRGLGSVFEVRFPAVEPLAASDDRASSESVSTTIVTPAPRRGRMLVVDDNVDGAEMMALFLTTLRFDVEIATDGAEGLDAALRFLPDVAILDIGLPTLDGYELARRIRSDERLRKTRLVAVTGYGQASDRAQATEAGFDAHLVKPVDPAKLRAVLVDLVESRPEG